MLPGNPVTDREDGMPEHQISCLLVYIVLIFGQGH